MRTINTTLVDWKYMMWQHLHLSCMYEAFTPNAFGPNYDNERRWHRRWYYLSGEEVEKYRFLKSKDCPLRIESLEK